MDFLDWLRWPTGPVCPKCGWTATTVGAGRVWRCGGCRKRVSRTAGTIFQDTRTPLTVWFAAAWYMTADPGGVSALTMQKLLGLGSYRLRHVQLPEKSGYEPDAAACSIVARRLLDSVERRGRVVHNSARGVAVALSVTAPLVIVVGLRPVIVSSVKDRTAA